MCTHGGTGPSYTILITNLSALYVDFNFHGLPGCVGTLKSSATNNKEAPMRARKCGFRHIAQEAKQGGLPRPSGSVNFDISLELLEMYVNLILRDQF